MDNLDIEFKESSTGSYSPWHLDVAEKYNVPLWGTSDIGYFVKVGEDIYKIPYSHNYYKMYEYVCGIEESNDNGEISDEETLNEINEIMNGNRGFKVEKCDSLADFEEWLKSHEKTNK